MKTLKELVDYQQYNPKITDLEIIKMWFMTNDQEQAGLELIPHLAKSRIDKVQYELDFARSWGLSVINMEDVIKDKEAACYLNLLIRCCTLNYPLESHSVLYIWAKENIPKMEVPKLFFMPTLAYLNQYGIQFAHSEAELKRSIADTGRRFNKDFYGERQWKK